MLRPFDNSFKPARKDVNCILMNGGVGDHIGSLVAIDYILRNYKWINLLIWVPDFLVDFAKHTLSGHAIVRGYSAMKEKYDREKITITTEWDGRTSPMKIHSVDYAFLKLCDEMPSIEKKNYLQIDPTRIDVKNFNLPEKYVVITTGYTVSVREFKASTVNAIANYVLSKGYTPVFIGQTDTKTGAKYNIRGNFSNEIDFTKGVNLINQTSLLQAAKVISGAQAIVGVDCGLLHVAGCTKTPIVAGFTTVRPELRAPIRDNVLGKDFYSIVPEASLQCRFCQSDTNFLYDHDYKYCMYKDYTCVKQLTPEKFIAQLEKLL